MLNGLYDLQQAYNAFTYKEPVYLKGDLLGIYEIQLIRTDWVKGVEKRSCLSSPARSCCFLSFT